jgi:hypothetical protein
LEIVSALQTGLNSHYTSLSPSSIVRKDIPSNASVKRFRSPARANDIPVTFKRLQALETGPQAEPRSRENGDISQDKARRLREGRAFASIGMTSGVVLRCILHGASHPSCPCVGLFLQQPLPCLLVNVFQVQAGFRMATKTFALERMLWEEFTPFCVVQGSCRPR